MNDKKELSRITIDMPITMHKRLKTLSVILGQSMRDIVVEAIEERLCRVSVPNKKTLEAIANVEAGKDLVEVESVAKLFKELGI